MLNSQELLHKNGNYLGSDEKFTPKYAVLPIVKFIPKGSVVWCPFDKKSSEFVKVLKLHGFKVKHSHIDKGKDFFNYEPKKWDVLISNPPFKRKREFFERALSFGKPIALLMTLAWMNDKYSKWVFVEANRPMELLMFDKRVHFTDDKGFVGTNTTFSSAYFCSNFLPNQIINETLDVK